MSQTILIENNFETKNLITLTLETFVGTEVIHQSSADDAIGLLKILPEVSLIVTRGMVGDETTARKLFDWIAENALPIGLIVLGTCEDLKDEVHQIPEPMDLDLLIHLVTEHLEVVEGDHPYSHHLDYVPFPLHYFYDLKKAPCDVFIRIRKDNNQYKFYKRVNAEESFDRWILNKYYDNGLREFYVQNEDRKLLIEFISTELMEKLKTPNLEPEEMIQSASNAQRIVREIIHKTGLDEVTINLSEASIQAIASSVVYSPEISSILKILLGGRIPYHYQLCHLQALMCHYILTKQSWYKARHLEALSFVAFFSDLSLHNEEQMEIGSMLQLFSSDLTDHEKRLVLEHPKTSFAAIAHHPMMNSYIRTVMLESHGKNNGIGIEENPTEDIHVLSKIFIIADNFVKIMLNPELPSNKKEILPILYERFSNPSYQKIIKTLEQRFQA